MVGLVSARILWNATSNLELRRSNKGLSDELVPQSATTVGNIYCRHDSPTMDAIQKQLLSRSKVCLALGGWTGTKKLVIMSVMAYYMDRIRALREVQPAFNEVDRLFISLFES